MVKIFSYISPFSSKRAKKDVLAFDENVFRDQVGIQCNTSLLPNVFSCTPKEEFGIVIYHFL